MDDRMVYIARMPEPCGKHPAGTIVGMMSDRPELRRDTAKAVARWLRNGAVIERVPLEWTRTPRLLTQDRYGPVAAP